MNQITQFPTIANTSTVFGKPSAEVIPLSTGTCPAEWREYWRERSIREHTDWQSVGLLAARIYWRLGLTSSLAWRSS